MKANGATDEVKQRGTTPEPPYAWFSKSAMNRIRDTFDSTGNVASAVAVYSALCEIASDEGRSTFSKPGAFIGFRAGVHRNTVRTVLEILREVGLVEYPEAEGLRVPYEITLLSLHNGCAALHNEKSSNCALVKVKEMNRKNEEKHATRGASSDLSLPITGLDDLGEEERQVVLLYNSTLPNGTNGWLLVTKVTRKLSEALKLAVWEKGEPEYALNTVRAVLAAPEAITLPKTKTLVRLLLDNMEGPDGWPESE